MNDFGLIRRFVGYVGAVAGCLLLSSQVVSAQSVTVSTVSELRSALSAANSAGGGRTILVNDGTYTLPDTLYVNAPNIVIAGASGARDKVIIQGDAMSSSAKVGSVIRVAASNFELRDVTLQKSKYHLIQIAGEENADGAKIRNCILRDAYQQMVKVSIDNGNPSVTGDNGLVENCLFEYTAGIGPQYYIGGIDAHGAKNWTVRGNTFRSIISPSNSVAEFAIHFWNGSGNNVVERNVIVNCDRGIGFGMDGQGNSGGIIRNNMIYHAANKGSFADVGIALIDSPSTRVFNNTVFMENSFPWAIEYRFSATSNVQIANNLTNKPVMSRDGGSGTLTKNVTNATAAWFKNVSGGDLHLASAVAAVVDSAQVLTDVTNDFDGQARPQGSAPDIGADELGNQVAPMPPTDLRAE